jgi:glycosyltransferase involved in cell wall biosynthesis
MNILFVNYSLGGYAGDSISMRTIVAGLQKIGHNVTIITTDGDGYFYDKKRSTLYSPIRQKLLKNVNKIIEIDGLKILPIHCVSSKFGMYCPSANKIGKKIIKEFDVIYIINWYYHLGMVLSKIAHKYNIPYIVGPMASLQEEGQNIKKYQKIILDQFYTKKMIRTANAFHCVGNQEKMSLLKFGADSNRIYIINNGILNINNRLMNSDIFKRINLNVEKYSFILTVGRLDKKKGLDVLIKSFSLISKKFNDLFLLIAGTGTDEYVNEIKELIKKLDLDKRVKFTGFVSENEKLHLLKTAKLFVLTSYSDVHPISAIEAMANGLPVVISQNSDFPEIDEYQAGKIVQNSEQNVSQTIVELLSDESKLKSYSKNALHLVEEKFLLKNQISQYEEIFLDVIDDKKF